MNKINDRLIPKDKSLRESYEKMDKRAKSEFSIADNCKDEWFWHIYNTERELDDTFVAKYLNEIERKR